MKYIYLALLFFGHQAFGLEVSKGADFLKGVKAITVYTQVYPHSLDCAFESALVKALSQHGNIIEIRSSEVSDNFFAAISNSTFLKLSLQNCITEDKGKKQFKVEMQIVLECSKNQRQKNSETTVSNCIWVEEQDFDFSPSEKKLIEMGRQAVKKLALQFVKAYRLQNSDEKGSLTFFIL